MAKRFSQSGFSVIEIGVVVVVIGVIGLLGWKFYDAKFNNTQLNNASERPEIDIVPGQLSDLKEIIDIKAAAIIDKPGVTVVHIELEQTSTGTFVYKAQLSDGTVTVFNARNGARIKTTTVSEKTSESLPENFATGIGFAKAVEIARAEKPNSRVYKIELELENNVVVYSVRFTDKARVDVKATDGTIVRTKAARPEKTKEIKEYHSNNHNKTVSGGDDGSSNDSGSSNDVPVPNNDSATSTSNSGKGNTSSDDDLSDSDDDDSDDDKSDDTSADDSEARSDNSGKGSDDN